MAAGEHALEPGVRHWREWRRRDNQRHRGRIQCAHAARAAQDLSHQLCHAVGYLIRRAPEIGFCVICAKHNDHQIERKMTGKGRGQIVGAVQSRIVGIVYRGRSGAQSLFDNMISVSQTVSHGAGPSFCKGISISGRPFPGRNPAPGQGIAITHD